MIYELKKKASCTIIVFLLFSLCLSVAVGADEDSDIWYCTNCGYENTLNFCANCGAAKPTDTCNYCGYEFKDNNVNYCPNCGKAIERRAVDETINVKTESFTTIINNTEKIQELSRSVVKLSCQDIFGNTVCTGSGFAAFDKNIIVTNYHVISDDVYSITASTESGYIFNLSEIVAYNEKYDLAILKSSEEINLEILTTGNALNLNKGEQVLAIGSPLGLINTVSTGVFSAIASLEDVAYLQFSAPISHGSSGGALFNEKGEIIGITSASFTEGQNINLAIPIEYAQELWNGRTETGTITVERCYNMSEHVYTWSSFANNIDKVEKEKLTIEFYVSDILEEINGSIRNVHIYLVSSKEEINGVYITSSDPGYETYKRNLDTNVKLNNMLVYDYTVIKMLEHYMSKNDIFFDGLDIGDHFLVNVASSLRGNGNMIGNYYYVLFNYRLA